MAEEYKQTVDLLNHTGTLASSTDDLPKLSNVGSIWWPPMAWPPARPGNRKREFSEKENFIFRLIHTCTQSNIVIKKSHEM